MKKINLLIGISLLSIVGLVNASIGDAIRNGKTMKPYVEHMPSGIWNEEKFSKGTNVYRSGGAGKLAGYITQAINGDINDLNASYGCRLSELKEISGTGAGYDFAGPLSSKCLLVYTGTPLYYGKLIDNTKYVSINMQGLMNDTHLYSFDGDYNNGGESNNGGNSSGNNYGGGSAYFNSPFIYLNGMLDNNVKITINSERNLYASQNPQFNIENGWELENKDGKLFVEGEQQEYLFYELAYNSITLTRNGRNFTTKEELIDFLNNSDFFSKLGFTEEQKNNSINYVIPKIEESSNYYLTILDNNSVENISKLNISPTPDNVYRAYFAIYPTTNKVKTNGDIIYPINTLKNGNFNVVETGEIYVKDMIVLWK